MRTVIPLATGFLWCHKTASSLLKPQSLQRAGLGAVGEELSPRGWEQGPLTAQSWSASPLRQPPMQGEPGQPWSSNIPLGGGGRGELCSHRFSQSWIAETGMDAWRHVTCWNFPF